MTLARFFASPLGRGLRVAVGLILLGTGLGTGHLWMWLVGVFLIVVGVVNVCGLGPLFGGPFNGRRVRRNP